MFRMFYLLRIQIKSKMWAAYVAPLYDTLMKPLHQKHVGWIRSRLSSYCKATFRQTFTHCEKTQPTWNTWLGEMCYEGGLWIAFNFFCSAMWCHCSGRCIGQWHTVYAGCHIHTLVMQILLLYISGCLPLHLHLLSFQTPACHCMIYCS